MKKFLESLIEKKKTAIADLQKRSDAATTVDEVRSIGAQIATITGEIREAEDQLRKLPEDAVSLNPLATYGAGSADKRAEDKDDMEYRTAFMNYVQKGVMADCLKRDSDDRIESTDLGVLIPQTVIQQIITGIEKSHGILYSKVRKLNVKGGVKFPINTFAATFYRIGENGAPTHRQNAVTASSYVTFGYNIGEIRIARSLLESVLEVPVFETEISKIIVEAYLKAMDKEILAGDPTNNECEGIITEATKLSGSRIPATNIIEFTEADMADWTAWQKNLFAKIPIGMRGERPEFVMTAGTYEANIKTLMDDNSRPVYAETFNPVDGTETATFKGKVVTFVEDDVLGNFDDISVAAETTDSPYFGLYWVPQKAYAINTNLQFYVKRYFDDEKNEYVDKALVINDGHVLDGEYVYLLKKVAE